MAKIDLGRKLGGEGILAISSEKTHYPELHIGDVDGTSLAVIPDSGKCVITYKVVSRTHHEDKRDKKPKERCSLTLEVHSIEPPPGKTYGNGAKDPDKGARSAMNNYFKDK